MSRYDRDMIRIKISHIKGEELDMMRHNMLSILK